MSFESLLHVVSLEIFRRMSGDGNIIVIEEALYVQVLCDCETSGFGIVSL